MTRSTEPPVPSPAPSVRTEDRNPDVAGPDGPIAIFGMACRSRGAVGIPAFRRPLHDGVNAVREGEPGSGVGRVGRSRFGYRAEVVFHDLESPIGALWSDGAMTAVSAGGMRK